MNCTTILDAIGLYGSDSGRNLSSEVTDGEMLFDKSVWSSDSDGLYYIIQSKERDLVGRKTKSLGLGRQRVAAAGAE